MTSIPQPLGKLDSIARQMGALTKEQMREHGFEFCYLNLLSVFRKHRTVAEVEQMALDCMRQHLCASVQFREFMQAAAHSSSLPAEFDRIARCVRFTPDALATLDQLQRTTGVLLAPFHWGAFRYIAMGLERSGRATTVLMDRATLEPQHHLLLAAKQHLQHDRGQTLGVQYVMAEDPAALVTAHRVLSSRGLVMIYPDGNSGWDGPKGAQGRTAVRFAGYTLRVKSGIARMAHVLQVPVAVIVAEHAPDGAVVVTIRKVLHPPQSRGTAAATPWISSCMQAIYSELERCVLKQPELWESARQLHRWREPATVDANGLLANWRDELEQALDRGKAFQVDTSRLSHVGVGDREMWVDAATMRAYGGTPFTTAALEQLGKPGGLRSLWRQTSADPLQREQLLTLLALLATRGLLQRSPSVSRPRPRPSAPLGEPGWSGGGASALRLSCSAPPLHSARDHHGAAHAAAG